jgi:DNA-binding transcriptional ArsR family regulator
MNIKLSSDNDHRVKIFKALADPTRIEIIRTLHKSRTEMNCGEVGEQCEASKSNASYHFKTLREAGLIIVRREGQVKYIQINYETFQLYLPGFLDTL